RLSREVGMASNERGTLLGGRCTYGRHHGRMQGRDRSERALTERGLRDPWRMLIDVAESSNKGLRVRGVQGCKQNWGHQRRRSHTLLSNRMRRGERAMLAVPMAGDVEPARDPHPVALGEIIQKSNESSRPPRPAHQAAMQPDRHHLGSPATFCPEHVEGIPQITEELIAMTKTL